MYLTVDNAPNDIHEQWISNHVTYNVLEAAPPPFLLHELY